MHARMSRLISRTIVFVAIGACGKSDAVGVAPKPSEAPTARAGSGAAPPASPGKVVVLDEIDPKAPVQRRFGAQITLPPDASAEMTTYSSKDPDTMPRHPRVETSAWSLEIDFLDGQYRRSYDT